MKLANHYQRLIGGLFARRTGRHTVEWWTDFIYSGGDRFLAADECVELGLVDEIVDDVIGQPPAGA